MSLGLVCGKVMYGGVGRFRQLPAIIVLQIFHFPPHYGHVTWVRVGGARLGMERSGLLCSVAYHRLHVDWLTIQAPMWITKLMWISLQSSIRTHAHTSIVFP